MKRPGLWLAACVALASPVSAQSAQGIVATLGLSAATIDGGTRAAISGGVGYRLSPVMTLGVELTSIPSLHPESPESSIDPTTLLIVIPSFSFDQAGGHAAVFTTNVRVDLPKRLGRLAPYVIGGGGAGYVNEHFRETVSFTPGPTVLAFPPGVIAFPPILPAPVVREISTTSNHLALTIGGGVSILAREHVSVDVEGRYLGLFGERTLHVGRFGAGVSYTF